ncbi:MAG: protein-glutamate O-methyltransferase CheR [Desulfobacterales bacterium]|nr:protein-glutamate O-methyltransferase CheR [Desulfobacterales bacterium]
MKQSIEDIEIDLVIEAIRLCYGYDFRNYARASLVRRIKKGLNTTKVQSISELIPMIVHDQKFFEKFFLNLSVNVTEMFRDASFYKSFRSNVIPFLRTYPFIKIWVAGCSTGEEVYSLSILLKEENLYEKCLIYATDFNDQVLEKAKQGIYPIEHIKQYTVNYQKSGGKCSFGDYYHADDRYVIIHRGLKENIVFANHNLATDSVFAEVMLVCCRNVLIYFNQTLQNRVFSLFRDSLCYNGFICLGKKETIKYSDISDDFQSIDEQEKIFQKKRF